MAPSQQRFQVLWDRASAEQPGAKKVHAFPMSHSDRLSFTDLSIESMHKEEGSQIVNLPMCRDRTPCPPRQEGAVNPKVVVKCLKWGQTHSTVAR